MLEGYRVRKWFNDGILYFSGELIVMVCQMEVIVSINVEFVQEMMHVVSKTISFIMPDNTYYILQKISLIYDMFFLFKMVLHRKGGECFNDFFFVFFGE